MCYDDVCMTRFSKMKNILVGKMPNLIVNTNKNSEKLKIRRNISNKIKRKKKLFFYKSLQGFRDYPKECLATKTKKKRNILLCYKVFEANFISFLYETSQSQLIYSLFQCSYFRLKHLK